MEIIVIKFEVKSVLWLNILKLCILKLSDISIVMESGKGDKKKF